MSKQPKNSDNRSFSEIVSPDSYWAKRAKHKRETARHHEIVNAVHDIPQQRETPPPPPYRPLSVVEQAQAEFINNLASEVRELRAYTQWLEERLSRLESERDA
jgi:hypothetical protein